jgi:hypothetical protein
MSQLATSSRRSQGAAMKTHMRALHSSAVVLDLALLVAPVNNQN